MDLGSALMIGVTRAVAAIFRRWVIAVALAGTMAGGCATNDTGAAEVWDPLETWIRQQIAAL